VNVMTYFLVHKDLHPWA